MKEKIFSYQISALQIFTVLFTLSSCFSVILLNLWLVCIPIICIVKSGKIDGAIDAMLLIQIRTIINETFAVSATSNSITSILKLLIIFILSLIIFLNNKNNINVYIKFTLGLYALWIMFSSLITSSYPLASLFKAAFYFIPFISIISAINPEDKEKWIKKLLFLFWLIVILSILSFLFGKGFYRTKYNQTDFFCGIINHPNLFSTIMILFLSLFLSTYKKPSLFTFAVILLSGMLIMLTKSRAGFIYFVLVSLLYIISMESTVNIKLMFLITIVLLCIVFKNNLNVLLLNIVNKYDTENFLASRTEQISYLIQRIKSNPLLGTGFNVPYIENIRTWKFSTNLVTENGNLFLAVLADSGIIGFILFTVAYGVIFFNGKEKLLFLAPILVSMSEMVFFSTNNIGILLYMFYALYLNQCKGKGEKNETCISE